MSNANFQVGFELKELKVGEKVTFSINYNNNNNNIHLNIALNYMYIQSAVQ